jgi:acetoacetyl-CoA synthetase
MQPKTPSQFSVYTAFLQQSYGLTFQDYTRLHQWSIENQTAFWESIARFFNVAFDTPYEEIYVPAIPFWKTKWFRGAKLSYVHHVFRNATPKQPAIIYQSETTDTVEISWAQLIAKTYTLQQQLIALGVTKGDVVVCYGINSPETLAAFLAANALGAVWSSCSPDFGTDAVCDRFAQLAPKVLLAHQQYTYGGKAFDVKTKIKTISDSIGSIENTLLLDDHKDFDDDFVAIDQIHVEAVSFSDPIWGLFSSGTTGKPKAIVHGAGHMLLEHLKALALHQNVSKGDRYFWYSTTGWMMWNYALGSLLSGATLCLYSGAPSFPTKDRLWQFAHQAKINHFGGGAVYFQDQVASPSTFVKQTDFSFFKTIGSTGSPMSAAVCSELQALFPSAQVISLSGGTDVCTAFVGGHPDLPVIPGEIQCKMLGAAVEVWNAEGNTLTEKAGELVLTQAFLSMPIYLLNDPEYKRYATSYFSKFKSVWHHGDWAMETKSGGIVIYGRSDATLNRSGVRIGTSELYNALSGLETVEDALVIHVYNAHQDQLLLFVQASKLIDTDAVKQHIRKSCSPRHVPDAIYLSPEIPYTISGKKVEIPIKRILMGEKPESVVSSDALRNPSALSWYVNFAKKLR